MLKIDDILLELSYKSPTGIIDLTNPKQIRELGRILQHNRVKNAEEIAMRAGINFGLLKEAKEKFKGPADPSQVGGMKAEDFEVYSARLFSIAAENKNKPMTDEQKAEVVTGIYIGHGEEMYNNIRKIKMADNMEKLGGDQPCTTDWKDWTGKGGDTPKTDIIGSKYKVSVKKGQAQIMSPEKKELLATFYAAAEHTQPGGLNKMRGELKDSVSNLIKLGNKLLSGLATDQGLQTGYLQQIRKIEDDKNLSEDEKLEKIEAIYDKINTKFKMANKEKGFAKGKGYKAINSLSENNLDLIKKFRESQKTADKLLAELESLCNNNAKFNRAFIYEAATGHIKFGKGTDGYADKLFAASMNGVDIHVMEMGSINSEAITKLEKVIHYEVSLKTNSYGPKQGPHEGYTLYQSLRMHVGELVEGSEVLTETINRGRYLIQNQRQLLTEWGWSDIKTGIEKAGKSVKGGWEWFKGQLNSVIQAIKEGWDWLMQKVKQFVNWLNSAAKNALKLLNEGVQHVFGILNTQPQISGNSEFNAEALI